MLIEEFKDKIRDLLGNYVKIWSIGNVPRAKLPLTPLWVEDTICIQISCLDLAHAAYILDAIKLEHDQGALPLSVEIIYSSTFSRGTFYLENDQGFHQCAQAPLFANSNLKLNRWATNCPALAQELAAHLARSDCVPNELFLKFILHLSEVDLIRAQIVNSTRIDTKLFITKLVGHSGIRKIILYLTCRDSNSWITGGTFAASVLDKGVDLEEHIFKKLYNLLSTYKELQDFIEQLRVKIYSTPWFDDDQGHDNRFYQLFLNQAEAAANETQTDLEEGFRAATSVLLCHVRLSFEDIIASANLSTFAVVKNDEILFRNQLLAAFVAKRNELSSKFAYTLQLFEELTSQGLGVFTAHGIATHEELCTICEARCVFLKPRAYEYREFVDYNGTNQFHLLVKDIIEGNLNRKGQKETAVESYLGDYLPFPLLNSNPGKVGPKGTTTVTTHLFQLNVEVESVNAQYCQLVIYNHPAEPHNQNCGILHIQFFNDDEVERYCQRYIIILSLVLLRENAGIKSLHHIRVSLHKQLEDLALLILGTKKPTERSHGLHQKEFFEKIVSSTLFVIYQLHHVKLTERDVLQINSQEGDIEKCILKRGIIEKGCKDLHAIFTEAEVLPLKSYLPGCTILLLTVFKFYKTLLDLNKAESITLVEFNLAGNEISEACAALRQSSAVFETSTLEPLTDSIRNIAVREYQLRLDEVLEAVEASDEREEGEILVLAEDIEGVNLNEQVNPVFQQTVPVFNPEIARELQQRWSSPVSRSPPAGPTALVASCAVLTLEQPAEHTADTSTETEVHELSPASQRNGEPSASRRRLCAFEEEERVEEHVENVEHEPDEEVDAEVEIITGCELFGSSDGSSDEDGDLDFEPYGSPGTSPDSFTPRFEGEKYSDRHHE